MELTTDEKRVLKMLLNQQLSFLEFDYKGEYQKEGIEIAESLYNKLIGKEEN